MNSPSEIVQAWDTILQTKKWKNKKRCYNLFFEAYDSSSFGWINSISTSSTYEKITYEKKKNPKKRTTFHQNIDISQVLFNLPKVHLRGFVLLFEDSAPNVRWRRSKATQQCVSFRVVTLTLKVPIFLRFQYNKHHNWDKNKSLRYSFSSGSSGSWISNTWPRSPLLYKRDLLAILYVSEIVGRSRRMPG